MGNIATDGRDDVSVEIVEQDMLTGQRGALQGHTGDQRMAIGKAGGPGGVSKGAMLENQMMATKQQQSNAPRKLKDVTIMGHAEFDYWRKKGNDLAVEALKNSERLPWPEFQQKLTLALQYYARTPSLKLLYGDPAGKAQQQKVDAETKGHVLRLFTQSRVGRNGLSYMDEILRIQKNRTVILRALIQNMYIQMQNSFLEEQKGQELLGQREGSNEGTGTKKDKQMAELLHYFLMFTENLNLTVRFVVDQLGKDLQTGEVGGASKKEDLRKRKPHVKGSRSKAESQRFKKFPMPNINDPGPGGSPVEVQESSSLHVGHPSHLLSSSRDRTSPKSPGQGLTPQEESAVWAQRFVEALQSCQFIFQDKFIKSLLQSEKDLGNKLKFLEKVYKTINPHNYEFLRKISWYMSKTYYKKAVQSQSGVDLTSSEQENESAALFLRRYEEYTKKIEQSAILAEARFLASDPLSEVAEDEVEKHRVRIENLQNIIAYLRHQQKAVKNIQQSTNKEQRAQEVKQTLPEQQLSPKGSEGGPGPEQRRRRADSQQQDLLELAGQKEAKEPDHQLAEAVGLAQEPGPGSDITSEEAAPSEGKEEVPEFVKPISLKKVRARRLSSQQRNAATKQRQDQHQGEMERSPQSKAWGSPATQPLSDGDSVVDVIDDEATVAVSRVNDKAKSRDTGSGEEPLLTGQVVTLFSNEAPFEDPLSAPAHDDEAGPDGEEEQAEEGGPASAGASRHCKEQNEGEDLEDQQEVVARCVDQLEPLEPEAKAEEGQDQLSENGVVCWPGPSPTQEEQKPHQDLVTMAAEMMQDAGGFEATEPAHLIVEKTTTITRIVVEKPVLLDVAPADQLEEPSPASHTNAVANLEVEDGKKPAQVASKLKIGKHKKEKSTAKSEGKYGHQRPLSPEQEVSPEVERLKMEKQEPSKTKLLCGAPPGRRAKAAHARNTGAKNRLKAAQSLRDLEEGQAETLKARVLVGSDVLSDRPGRLGSKTPRTLLGAASEAKPQISPAASNTSRPSRASTNSLFQFVRAARAKMATERPEASARGAEDPGSVQAVAEKGAIPKFKAKKTVASNTNAPRCASPRPAVANKPSKQCRPSEPQMKLLSPPKVIIKATSKTKSKAKSPLRNTVQPKAAARQNRHTNGHRQAAATPSGPKQTQSKPKAAATQAAAATTPGMTSPRRPVAPQKAKATKPAKEPTPRATPRPATSRKAIKSPAARPTSKKVEAPAPVSQGKGCPHHGKKPTSPPAQAMKKRARERQPSPAPVDRRANPTNKKKNQKVAASQSTKAIAKEKAAPRESSKPVKQKNLPQNAQKTSTVTLCRSSKNVESRQTADAPAVERQGLEDEEQTELIENADVIAELVQDNQDLAVEKRKTNGPNAREPDDESLGLDNEVEPEEDGGSQNSEEDEAEEAADEEEEEEPEPPVAETPVVSRREEASTPQQEPTQQTQLQEDQGYQAEERMESEKPPSTTIPEQKDASEPVQESARRADSQTVRGESSSTKRVIEEQLDQDHRYATPAEAELRASTRSEGRARVEPHLAQLADGTNDSLKSMQTARAQHKAGMIGQEEDSNLRLPGVVVPQSSEGSAAHMQEVQAKPSLPSATKPKAQPSYRRPGRSSKPQKPGGKKKQPIAEPARRQVAIELTPKMSPPTVQVDKPERRPSAAAKEEEAGSTLLRQIDASLSQARAGQSLGPAAAKAKGSGVTDGEKKQSRLSAVSSGVRSRPQSPRSKSSLRSGSSPVPNARVCEDDFEPLKQLGRGSFGDVYLVRRRTPPGQGLGPLYAMKTLRKRSNLEESWLRYVRTERDVLAESDHPFIVSLKYAFQTRAKLFLVMDFCPGGDLEALLAQERGPLPEEKAKFYIAEILLAMKDLHARNIIYRDLKPDNVVLDNEGHAQLVDFGMAKDEVTEAQKGARTFCGSVKYLAPEMLKKAGHGQALDWYLLGVLLYEMVVGVTPYFSSNKDTLFNNILYGKLKLPRTISTELKDLLIALLHRTPTKRLGSAPGDDGALAIMKHPFFEGIDWPALMKKENNGKFRFWPEPPKHTLEDYQEAFPETQLTPEQIQRVYSGEDEDWSEDEDYGEAESEARSADGGQWRAEPLEEEGARFVDSWDFVRGDPGAGKSRPKEKLTGSIVAGPDACRHHELM